MKSYIPNPLNKILIHYYIFEDTLRSCFFMLFKIVRIDGKEDEVTTKTFTNYADAYDLLDKIYGDICCSDTDYEDIIYYDIVEN